MQLPLEQRSSMPKPTDDWEGHQFILNHKDDDKTPKRDLSIEKMPEQEALLSPNTERVSRRSRKQRKNMEGVLRSDEIQMFGDDVNVAESSRYDENGGLQEIKDNQSGKYENIVVEFGENFAPNEIENIQLMPQVDLAQDISLDNCVQMLGIPTELNGADGHSTD